MVQTAPAAKPQAPGGQQQAQQQQAAFPELSSADDDELLGALLTDVCVPITVVTHRQRRVRFFSAVPLVFG